MTKRMGCEAIQQSDQMCCNRCHLVWDMNDSAPPDCLTKADIARLYDQIPVVNDGVEQLGRSINQLNQAEINRRGIAKLKKVLNDE